MTDTSHDMEPFNLQFPFTRTLGSTLSTFFSALAEGQLIGVNVNGRVIAPPLEYDPETGADAGTDYVKVGPKGTVSSLDVGARAHPPAPAGRALRLRLHHARRGRHAR